MIDQDRERAELKAQYPGWHIRRPKMLACEIATRVDRRGLSDSETYAGMAMTLIAETTGELAGRLAEQVEIEAALRQG